MGEAKRRRDAGMALPKESIPTDANTLTLAYAGRGLYVFKATDENLEKLPVRVAALKFEGDDFTDAATRLMHADDLAKVGRGDFDVTILMALGQIGRADLDDPGVRELLASGKLIAEMLAESDGRFKNFLFSSGDDPTRFINWTANKERLN